MEARFAEGRMFSIRYQVFISSTFRDLVEERQKVHLAIQKLNHIPAGMELFTAGNEPPWDIIERVIQTSDYYVLVVGGRYGSTNSNGLSFTEREYDLAVKLGIPVLAFLHGDVGKLTSERTDLDPELRAKLETFRAKIETTHHCTYWMTADELTTAVVVGLVNEIARNSRQGWVRGDLVGDTSQLLSTLEEVRRENDSLRMELQDAIENQSHSVEDLLQGNDLILVRIKGTAAGDERVFERELSVQDMFQKIGYEATSGITESKAGTDIARLALKSAESFITVANISTIRNQFVALGFIDVVMQHYTVSNRNGPYTQTRVVWQLTDRGQRLYALSNALKRAAVGGVAALEEE